VSDHNVLSISNQGVSIETLLLLERMGAKRFQFQGGNGIFHYAIAMDNDSGKNYMFMYANGQRADDFFVQVPVLRKEGKNMMFLNHSVEKDHVGWRVVG
jgi:hypothetical protein